MNSSIFLAIAYGFSLSSNCILPSVSFTKSWKMFQQLTTKRCQVSPKEEKNYFRSIQKQPIDLMQLLHLRNGKIFTLKEKKNTKKLFGFLQFNNTAWRVKVCNEWVAKSITMEMLFNMPLANACSDCDVNKRISISFDWAIEINEFSTMRKQYAFNSSFVFQNRCAGKFFFFLKFNQFIKICG